MNFVGKPQAFIVETTMFHHKPSICDSKTTMFIHFHPVSSKNHIFHGKTTIVYGKPHRFSWPKLPRFRHSEMLLASSRLNAGLRSPPSCLDFRNFRRHWEWFAWNVSILYEKIKSYRIYVCNIIHKHVCACVYIYIYPYWCRVKIVYGTFRGVPDVWNEGAS